MNKIILLFTLCVLMIDFSSSEEKIRRNLDSDIFKDFQKQWQGHRKSFENAIVLALKENYGLRGLNVYVKRPPDSLRLADGFYTNDNIVGLLLLDMTLSSLPYLIMPELTFTLASNVLFFEASLSKMIIDAKYILFRNQSNILYKMYQDPYINSPFSYQQIENEGQLAIISDGCIVKGLSIARLSGDLVNLGHEQFQVQNCKFSIEISSSGNKGPPVIAPYFSNGASTNLHLLLKRPICEELKPKLQAAVYTYINTSSIFGDNLLKFRKYQDDMFKKTNKNITQFIERVNNAIMNLNGGTLELESEEVSWDGKCQKGLCWNNMKVSNVTLYGLDTLYSSHSGGNYKSKGETIYSEALRFDSLLVRGFLHFENDTFKEEHSFVVEIRDMVVNIKGASLKDLFIESPTMWRSLSLSVADLKHDLKKHEIANAFTTAYLIKRLSGALSKYLDDIFAHINQKPSTVQKLGNINVNCNNMGGGMPWGFPGWGYVWG